MSERAYDEMPDLPALALSAGELQAQTERLIALVSRAVQSLERIERQLSNLRTSSRGYSSIG